MFSRFKFIILLSFFITTSCGGGGNDLEKEIVSTETFNTLSGTATKGIIKNGIVEVYGVLNGTKDIEPLITGNTDNNGNYTLTIKNYLGPVFIEISADPSKTKMICDIYPTCGGVAFGSEISLDSDFRLKAAVSNLEKNKTVTANINSITSLVAALAESKRNIDATIINNSNSQVADLFGMTGKLTEKPVIDITNSKILNTATSDVLNMAVLNSALVSSAMNEDTDITDGLKKLLTGFKDTDGQFLNRGDEGEISMEAIYGNAKQMLNMEIFSDADMGSLKASITLKETYASNQEKGSFTQAVPTEVSGAVYLDSARNLVKDIRDFSLQSTYKSTEEFSVAKELEDAINLVNADEISILNNTFELTVKAFEGAYLQTIDDQKNNLAFNNMFVFEHDKTDILVTISEIDNEFQYSINQNVEEIAVDLSATTIGKGVLSNNENIEEYAHDDSTHSEYGLSTLETAQASFHINGLLTGEKLAMNIATGTASVTHNYNAMTIDSINIQDRQYDEYISFAFDLNLSLTENIKIDPLKFSGNFKFDTEISLSTSPQKFDESLSQKNASYANKSNITLSGEIEKNQRKTSITASISDELNHGDLWLNDIDLSQPETHINEKEHLINNNFSFFDLLNVATEKATSAIEFLDIDGANYYSQNFGLSLQFKTSNISNISGIDLVASTSKNGNKDGSLEIEFGKKRLYIDYDPAIENPELVITNQHGNTLKIVESCYSQTKQCSNIGSIVIAGEEIATISVDSSADVDAYVIEYIDSSSELLTL